MKEAYPLFLEEILEILPSIQVGLCRLGDRYNPEVLAELWEIAQMLKQGATQVGATAIQEMLTNLLVLLESFPKQQLREIEGDSDVEMQSILNTNTLEKLWQNYKELRNYLLDTLSQNPSGIIGILAKGESLFALSQSLLNDKEILPKQELDISKTILNQDVVQSLEDLETILNSPTIYKLEEELKLQAEVFLGLGEILENSDFITLAQGAIALPKTNLETTQLIGQRLLTSWAVGYNSGTTKAFSSVTIGQLLPLDEEIEEKWIYEVTATENEGLKVENKVQQTVLQEGKSLWDRDNITGSSPLSLPASSNDSNSEIILTTKDSLIWLSGFNLFFLAAKNIQAMISPQSKEIVTTENQQFFSWQSQLIPCAQLSSRLVYNRPLPPVLTPTQSSQILIISHNQQFLALEIQVEKLIVKPELNLKPFASTLTAPSYLPGCTYLENGQMVVVVDVLSVLSQSTSSVYN
jgi:chemotaxis protein histidine kinase CheA